MENGALVLVEGQNTKQIGVLGGILFPLPKHCGRAQGWSLMGGVSGAGYVLPLPPGILSCCISSQPPLPLPGLISAASLAHLHSFKPRKRGLALLIGDLPDVISAISPISLSIGNLYLTWHL